MKFNRRQILQGATVAGLGAVAVAQFDRPSKAQKAGKSRLLAQADPYAAQVDAGLAYFQEQAVKQLPLVEALAAAIASGDLEAAKKAYVESRPPYEQIEVLALNFEQSDSDIDARPYAFDNGEEDEAAIATVAPYFTEGQVAAQPYSSLDASQRGEIVKVSYRFRDSLINAQSKLGIA